MSQFNYDSTSTAVDIVNTLILYAIEKYASDIHWEPLETEMSVRYRIDGSLHKLAIISSLVSAQVISRIKILAYIDVSEKRIPQDGKFTLLLNKRTIDLRVATFPTQYGEKIVIRILDKSSHLFSLDSLGMSLDDLKKIKKLLNLSQGFFLVTGPTGSGKTTTLYSLLTELVDVHKNIVTLEDPIEYTIDGVTQSKIIPDIGFTFAKGLRSLLRQDPDVIMVGEIRDAETASVVLQAALTGHLVLSTLHTTDATGVLFRLIDMGVPSFLLSAALGGVLAQRLVKRLCDLCKYNRILTDEEKLFIEYYNLPIKNSYFAAGCPTCLNLGYKGRLGIFELFLISPEIQSIFVKSPQKLYLYKQALAEGMTPLLLDGALKVNQGLISLAELRTILV